MPNPQRVSRLMHVLGIGVDRVGNAADALNDSEILTDPIYAGLINRIRIAGGVPIFAPLIPTTDGWRLDLKDSDADVLAATLI